MERRNSIYGAAGRQMRLLGMVSDVAHAQCYAMHDSPKYGGISQRPFRLIGMLLGCNGDIMCMPPRNVVRNSSRAHARP
jgi:hypothetical protein